MGKGCVTWTKYFLFLFNLIFFLLGAIIMGFGLWLILDNQSFIVVFNDSIAVKAACYILIGVGTFSMLMGFLGCLGAIYEILCLLGLYFTCLLLILIAEIVAGALIYFQNGVLKEEMSKIVSNVLDNYPGNNSTTEQAWDFIQRNMECCGWNGQGDWNGNVVIINNSQLLFPCSCHNISLVTGNISESGFCEALTPDWPVYDKGCARSVENWLLTNIGVVLGISIAVAFIEDPAGKTRRRRDRRKVDRLPEDQACPILVGSMTSSASVSYAPPASYEYVPTTTRPARHILLDSDFSEYEEDHDLYDRLPQYNSDYFNYESLHPIFHPSQFASPPPFPAPERLRPVGPSTPSRLWEPAWPSTRDLRVAARGDTQAGRSLVPPAARPQRNRPRPPTPRRQR